MCKRSDDDPLIRVLTDRYKLNILRLPRRGIGVGEILIKDGRDLRCAGSAKKFFDPELDIPEIKSATLPDIEGVSSTRLSADAAGTPLIGLLTALGVPLASSVGASLRKTRDVSVTFALADTRYLNTDLITLGGELTSRILRRDNALYSPRREFFITYATAEASVLNVTFTSAKEEESKLHLELAEIINAKGQIATVGNQSGHLSIASPEPITFGLSVSRLKLDGDTLRLDTVKRLRAVRGEATQLGAVDDELSFLFGGTDGEVLVELN